MKKALWLLLGLSLAGASPVNSYLLLTSSDIVTIDPHQAADVASGQVVQNIYETLIGLDGKNLTRYKPLLAELPTISADGRTYTFKLRQAKFHSGNSFGCGDAEYSFKRALVTNNPTSAVWQLADSLLGSELNAKSNPNVTWTKINQAIQCKSANELIFKLPKSDATFLAKLTSPSASIIDALYAKQLGEWDGNERTWRDWVGKDLSDSALNAKPSGTGAYNLLERSKDRVVLQAFNDYWNGKPALDTVAIQKTSETATRIAAIKRGDADEILLDRSSLEQLKGLEDITIIDNLPNINVAALLMNQAIKGKNVFSTHKFDESGIPADFFRDVNLRKAFAYSFDYDRYIKEVQQGKATKRTMALPGNFLGYTNDIKTYNFDLKLAADYFKKAWNGNVWNNGFRLKIDYRAGNVVSQSAIELLKLNIESINPKFHLDISSRPWPDLLELANDGEIPLMYVSSFADYTDSDFYMRTFYHSRGFYSPRTGYFNQKMDNLIDQARQTTDNAKRVTLYKQIGQIAYEEVPLILLPVPPGYAAIRKEIKGWLENHNPMINGGVLWRNLSK